MTVFGRPVAATAHPRLPRLRVARDRRVPSGPAARGEARPGGEAHPPCRKGRDAIILDANASLTGFPESVWAYRLGSRSALEWVLEQYKERNPATPPSPSSSRQCGSSTK